MLGNRTIFHISNDIYMEIWRFRRFVAGPKWVIVEFDFYIDTENILAPIDGSVFSNQTPLVRADHLAEFTCREQYHFTKNGGAYLSGTYVSLGRLGLTSHVLNRNSYRMSLNTIKYANTPNKTIKSVRFNKNSDFQAIYSSCTVV